MPDSSMIAMSLHLAPSLSQRQIQAMRMLEMDAMELEEYLESQAIENPVVEIVRPDYAITAERCYDPHALQSSDADMDDYGERGDGLFGVNRDEFFLEQIDPRIISRDDERVLRYLIGNLDEGGYLRVDSEFAAAALAVGKEAVERAVSILQGLDPCGVGARSVEEFLLLQLERIAPRTHLVDLALDIVRGHLSLVAQNRISAVEGWYPKEAKQDVRSAVALIRSLNARIDIPWSQAAARYVVADVAIEASGHSLKVSLDAASDISVRIDRQYKDFVKRARCEGDVRWISSRYKEAYWLAYGLECRKRMLLRIASALADRQGAFFMQGPSHASVPPTMTELADDLGVSPSTVSRAVKGSYVRCAWGTVPMRSLFSSSPLDRRAGVRDIPGMLKDIIHQEDPEHPLSDQAIAEACMRAGLDISRRSVARYRKEMGIPPAHGRKGWSPLGA